MRIDLIDEHHARISKRGHSLFVRQPQMSAIRCIHLPHDVHYQGGDRSIAVAYIADRKFVTLVCDRKTFRGDARDFKAVRQESIIEQCYYNTKQTRGSRMVFKL